MDKRDYQVTIKGIALDDRGQILLAREKSGVWDLPGGRIEHGETFHECLQRECVEEMGLVCEIIDHTPHWAWPALHSDGLWKVVLCFRIRLPHLNFIASDECVALEFFDAHRFTTFPVAQQIQPLKTHLPHSPTIEE